jgi:hypothetical protein
MRNTSAAGAPAGNTQTRRRNQPGYATAQRRRDPTFSIVADRSPAVLHAIKARMCNFASLSSSISSPTDGPIWGSIAPTLCWTRGPASEDRFAPAVVPLRSSRVPGCTASRDGKEWTEPIHAASRRKQRSHCSNRAFDVVEEARGSSPSAADAAARSPGNVEMRPAAHQAVTGTDVVGALGRKCRISARSGATMP